MSDDDDGRIWQALGCPVAFLLILLFWPLILAYDLLMLWLFAGRRRRG